MTTKKNGEKVNRYKEEKKHTSITKMIYIILLYVFYLFGGLFNEKLTKTEYEYLDENNNIQILKFKYPAISLCFPSILSFAISYFMLNKMKKTESPISFHDKSIIGILYIISSFSSQTALIYLDFIVKTIGKSCKSASIMFIYFLNTIPFCNKLLKRLLNNNKLSGDKNAPILLKDIIKVLMTTTSVILFNLSSDSKKTQTKNENGSSYFGISILILSLFVDGLLSLKESMIKNNILSEKKYEGYDNMLSWEYMNIFSFFTFSFSFCQIIFNLFFGNYAHIFKIIFTNSILLKDLILYAVFDVLGQSVLYIFLGKYGPLALSMVTSVRKILTISISILYFGKTINFPQSISLLLAGTIIFMEIYDKGNKNNSLKTQGKRK